MNRSKFCEKIKRIWNYILACLIAVIVMIPFLWMLSTSFKSKGALMQIPIEWIPKEPTWDSYKMVFSRFPFLRAILNSFLITCSYTVVTILSASMAAFAFTKIQFPYANTIFKLYQWQDDRPVNPEQTGSIQFSRLHIIIGDSTHLLYQHKDGKCPEQGWKNHTRISVMKENNGIFQMKNPECRYM